MKILAITMLLGPICLSLYIVSGSAASTIVSDDFSKDSYEWEYVGSAKLGNGVLEVVPNEANKVGAVWYVDEVPPPFEITFKIKIQGTAEGLTFKFNTNPNYTPAGGKYMGTTSSTGTGDGWVVEFDTNAVSQYWDEPSGTHIALASPGGTYHWEQNQARTFNNGVWHTVVVRAEEDGQMIVTFDGSQLFDTGHEWSFRNTKYYGIGFTAATGANGGIYQVDDVKITNPYGTDPILYILIPVGAIVAIVVLVMVVKKMAPKSVPAPASVGAVDLTQHPMDGKLEQQIFMAARASSDPEVKQMHEKYKWSRMPGIIFNLLGVVFCAISPVLLALVIPGVICVILGLILMLRARPTQKQLSVYMGIKMGIIQSTGANPQSTTQLSASNTNTMMPDAATQNVIVCKKCGTNIPFNPELKFCTNCGNPL